MSHTYAQNTVHVVFSTKERRRSISPELQSASGATSRASAKNVE